MLFLRLLKKHVSLRLVNLAGLSVVLSAILISSGFIIRELSWDRHNSEADRIFRLTLADRGQTADGRIWGNRLDDVLRQISEVECVAKLHEVYRPEFEYQGKFIVPEEKTCLVNRDFLRTFDISMPDGDIYDRLGSPDCVVISESLAGKFRGYGGDLSPELKSGGTAYHIAGIFKDIPETSHWRADVLALLPDSIDVFCYTYLLLRDGSDAESVQQKINAALDGMELEDFSDPQASLMPLTDIHLRSCNLRELDVNGNIVYIWLVTGANVLLLIVVLFNLWFNSTLIFSYNSGMYRLLRLHGAPANVILRTEALQGLAMALAATAAGLLLTAYISGTGAVQGEMPPWAVCTVGMAFIAVVVAVSVVPAAGGMSMTYFLDGQFSGTQLRFSYKNVHRMISVQYAIVITVLVLSAGICRQMNMMENTQTGGDSRDVMVMRGLTEPYMEKFPLLRDKIAGSTLLQGMTTCFQIPGEAIRDHINVRCGGGSDWVDLPVMVAGDDFIGFHEIPLLAGDGFAPLQYDLQQEVSMMMEFYESSAPSDRQEEYIINAGAMRALGFSSPDDAVGRPLEIRHGSLGYISRGVVAGVTDDYNYTGLFEETTPLVMLHRNLFQFVLMVRLDASRPEEAMRALDAVWAEVYPDCESDFVPMSDIFRNQYRNELNARNLVLTFTLLCFLVADLGLIVFMAFIIRRRTREIAIRKINGATSCGIVGMLNSEFIRSIAVAFVAAAPASWLILHIWLRRFAYRISLDWWLFAGAGIVVLVVSLLSVSVQSWHAARANPADGIRK